MSKLAFAQGVRAVFKIMYIGNGGVNSELGMPTSRRCTCAMQVNRGRNVDVTEARSSIIRQVTIDSGRSCVTAKN